ncbi:hypothetical protein MTBPR1_30103 [Candidatus Terasakiella magnetica]|uniref:AAA+ ATPase domain-containing protein n=1 Tax=Candidatus Terasakiella magnetica TaxID=1867952 RepID=A0A1C3RHI0_9PROT|nr:DUF87 domain-containing protein [Candidatus Terasakiella magnetica]SCA56733.1 hypothetical protein MTBPR1_30103 [Candidatus Terasakiella magnetica]
MKKEEIIYNHLGLPYPGNLGAHHFGFLNVGHFKPIQLGPKAVIDVMERYLDLIENLLESSTSFPETQQVAQDHNFIHFNLYLKIFQAYRSYQRDTRSAENLIREESRQFKHDLAQQRDPFSDLKHLSEDFKNCLRQHYQHMDKVDVNSYLSLLQSTSLPICRFFTSPLAFHLPEDELKRHVLLTGNSGAGKSTFLKELVNSCANNGESSVIVIDPAGNMAREIAKNKDIPTDRLVYIDPMLKGDTLPVFNPLDLTDTSDTSIHLACEEIVATFQETLRGSGGNELTNNMHALLYPCVSTLLRLGGQTFFDLQRFLQNDEELIAAGCGSPNQAVAKFFEKAFLEKKFETTKLSLYTKLQSLLNSPVFAQMTARPKSTIALESIMSEDKILVVNLAKGAIGAETSEALGRFLIASIKGHIQKRCLKEGEPHPVFLIVDEVQNYVSPSTIEILRENRKYGLHLIASTQFISDMDPKVQAAFLSVTNVKITGKNAVQTLNVMARETGAKLEDLQNLKLGTFSFKIDTAQPVTVNISKPTERVMNAEQWHDFTKEQISLYYSPLTAQVKTKKPRDENEQRQAKFGL